MERYLPWKISKPKALCLLGILVAVYIIDALPSFQFTSNYSFKIILWGTIIFAIWLLPSVKPFGKLRLRSFMRMWAFNFAIVYVLVFIAAGFFDGFGKSPYGHSPYDIATNIICFGSMLVAREMIRSKVVNVLTKEENYVVFLFVALVMTVVNIEFEQYMGIKEEVQAVKFIAQYFAPELVKNLFATYLVFLGGPVASIIFMGVTDCFMIFAPILPNLKWITKALVGILCPIFSFMILQNLYAMEIKEIKTREKKKEGLAGWIVTCILSIGVIWFAVGVFPIYPSVIATGSMEPLIMPGDVILVQRIEGDKAKLGEIIQFKRENILISHRVIEIIKEKNKISYKTKGDNNSCADGDLVTPGQVKGRVIKVIPKIGWPTLLLKSKDEVSLEKVQF